MVFISTHWKSVFVRRIVLRIHVVCTVLCYEGCVKLIYTIDWITLIFIYIYSRVKYSIWNANHSIFDFIWQWTLLHWSDILSFILYSAPGSITFCIKTFFSHHFREWSIKSFVRCYVFFCSWYAIRCDAMRNEKTI